MQVDIWSLGITCIEMGKTLAALSFVLQKLLFTPSPLPPLSVCSPSLRNILPLPPLSRPLFSSPVLKNDYHVLSKLTNESVITVRFSKLMRDYIAPFVTAIIRMRI